MNTRNHQLLDELKDIATGLFCELHKRESFRHGIYPNSIVRSQASAERQLYFDITYFYCTVDAELSDSQYSTAVELLDAGRKVYHKLASTK